MRGRKREERIHASVCDVFADAVCRNERASCFRSLKRRSLFQMHVPFCILEVQPNLFLKATELQKKGLFRIDRNTLPFRWQIFKILPEYIYCRKRRDELHTFAIPALFFVQKNRAPRFLWPCFCMLNLFSAPWSLFAFLAVFPACGESPLLWQ